MTIIAVVVTYCTKPKPLSELQGLVIGTMNRAKELYKGGPLNEVEGKKALGTLSIKDGLEGISVNSKMLELMKARMDDLVYLEDGRKWLGGLRSVHSKIKEVHEDSDDKIYVGKDLVEEGELLVGRMHRMEKIF